MKIQNRYIASLLINEKRLNERRENNSISLSSSTKFPEIDEIS